MSALETSLAEIVRQVVREELQTLRQSQPEELLLAEDVARLLHVNKQKVYALVRENELEAVRISQREMRFRPEAVKEFQLSKGIKAA